MASHRKAALHDDHPGTGARRYGAALAGHLGDEDEARAALSDGDATVRATALGALVRMGRADVADLTDCSRDPAPNVRRRAAELAFRLRTVERHGDLVGILLPLLEDPENEVVEAAAFSLGELKAEEALRPLEAVALHHDDALCRESAVAALGAMGRPESLPAILAALAGKPPIRRRAVLALASYEGPEVDAALAAALDDRDWQVRQAAEDLSGSRRLSR